MRFMDQYKGMREKESIECDYECPRCGGPIIHKRSDYSMIPDWTGDKWMLWYICEEETCNCSWMPRYIEKWNARPEKERLHIRKLEKEAKKIEEVMASGEPYNRLQEIYDELNMMGVGD